RMQSALHQHTRPPEFYRLADLLVDGFEIQNVTLFGLRAFQGAVEGAESAVLGAEVGVIDVAVNDVGDHAFGVQLSPHRVRFHANADQVIGTEQLYGLCVGQRHNL